MGGELRAVAGERQAQCLGEAIHRIGGEHARARAAGGAGRAFDLGHFLVRIALVRRGHHRIDQIERDFLALEHDLARFHRPAGNEHHRHIQPHRRHQHSRRDLVAIGNAHHRVRAVGVDHVLHRVGDQIAAGERIEHPVMPHRDAIIDGDGVEFLGHAPRRLDLPRDQLAEILQVHMARYELGEGVDDRDDRLAEIAILHARGAPQPARARHVAAVGGGAGTVGGHGTELLSRCSRAVTAWGQVFGSREGAKARRSFSMRRSRPIHPTAPRRTTP